MAPQQQAGRFGRRSLCRRVRTYGHQPKAAMIRAKEGAGRQQIKSSCNGVECGPHFFAGSPINTVPVHASCRAKKRMKLIRDTPASHSHRNESCRLALKAWFRTSLPTTILRWPEQTTTAVDTSRRRFPPRRAGITQAPECQSHEYSSHSRKASQWQESDAPRPTCPDDWPWFVRFRVRARERVGQTAESENV